MRKIVPILSILPIILAMTLKLQLSVNYEVTHNEDGTANIKVTVENGNPEYVFLLYDKAPWNEGQIVESRENVRENTIDFKGLSNRDYFLMVQDSDKNIISVSINISKEESN